MKQKLSLLILGCPETDKEIFLELHKTLKDIHEVIFFNTPNEIKIERIKNHTIVYCYQRDNSDVLFEDIKLIKKSLTGHIINVIMTTKDYDSLMTAYQSNLCEILERPLTLKKLKKSVFKSSIISEMGKNIDEVLPYTKLMSLFSTPEKLSSDEELIAYLNDYFRLFDGVKNFFVLNQKKQQLKIVLNKKKINIQEKKVIFKHLDTFHKKRNIDEFFKIFNFDEDTKVCLFQLTKTNNEPIYAGVVANRIKIKKIINHYLLKFLENVNLFRTSQTESQKLKNLALTDDITGLFNQRKLSLDLKEQINWHELNHKKFCIMFIDVDHFKLVNDNWGHVVGSKMLIQIGDLLKKTLRQTDYIYRYGGDEFVVIMPNADRENVYHVASRICHRVKDMDFKIDAKNIHKLSLSIGIGEFPTDAHSAHEIINFADVMMYKSKKAGRGKVFHINEVAS
jgi:diguanylate cyclase (GGDEF)-like protein